MSNSVKEQKHRLEPQQARLTATAFITENAAKVLYGSQRLFSLLSFSDAQLQTEKCLRNKNLNNINHSKLVLFLITCYMYC